jgi:RNA polymerase sigma-70 factor (ECF subfamily)
VDYSHLDDDALLRLIMRAQADALSELYGRYGRLVFSIALKIVPERETAEEITLDVFTKVWQKAATYRSDRGSVRVWLSAMTRNRAIDIYRKEGVRLDARSLRWAEVTSPPVSNERNPETAVELNLRKGRIRAAMAQLPEKQRDVLALAYFKGYTQSEIADLRNLPLGTVKTRIRLAIQKLRHLLQEEHSAGE